MTAFRILRSSRFNVTLNRFQQQPETVQRR
jgi:hypothetical protein